jgi:hypothetical protein
VLPVRPLLNGVKALDEDEDELWFVMKTIHLLREQARLPR